MASMASRNKLLPLLLQRTAAARTLSPFSFSPYKRYSSSLPLPSSAAPSSSSSLPLLLLPSAGGDEQERNFKSFFSLGNGKVTSFEKELPEEIADAHCAGSSNGWLAFVNRRDCQMYLADLFSLPSSPKIVPLPPFMTLPSDSHVAIVYGDEDSVEHFVEYDLYTGKTHHTKTPDLMSRHLMGRLAMSSAPIFADDLNRNCVVMISHYLNRRLAFCRIGLHNWRGLDGARGLDVVYSKKHKLFYSLTSRDGDIKSWDFRKVSSPTGVDIDITYSKMDPVPEFFTEEIAGSKHRTTRYLVESPEGDILLLVRYSVSIDEEDESFVNIDNYPDEVLHPYRTAWFDVYKLDFEKKTGEPVRSLGETSLFVGFNESFSLSALDHPEIRPNSIYFADDYASGIFSEVSRYGGDDMGIYNLEDHSVSPLLSSRRYCLLQFGLPQHSLLIQAILVFFFIFIFSIYVSYKFLIFLFELCVFNFHSIFIESVCLNISHLIEY